MRLNKSDKQAFIRSVMDDVPEIDYDEQIKKLAQQFAYEAMPKAVQDVYDNKAWRDVLDHKFTNTPNGLPGLWIYRMPDFDLTPAHIAALRELNTKLKEQCSARNALESKVTGLIEGCSTLKTALERMPEFAKYLPADRDGTGVAGLPAISNVVAELVSAGWPKSQQLQGV